MFLVKSLYHLCCLILLAKPTEMKKRSSFDFKYVWCRPSLSNLRPGAAQHRFVHFLKTLRKLCADLCLAQQLSLAYFMGGPKQFFFQRGLGQPNVWTPRCRLLTMSDNTWKWPSENTFLQFNTYWKFSLGHACLPDELKQASPADRAIK